MRSPRPILASVLALAAVLAPSRLAAQTEQAGFVMLLGNDTIAVEEFTVGGGRLEGRQVLRSPRVTLTDYVATVDADGAISRVELTAQRPGEPAPFVHGTIEFDSDSATITVQRGDSTTTSRVAAPRGTLPWIGGSVAIYEPAIRRARDAGADSSGVMVLTLNGQSFPLTVLDLGSNRYELRNIAGSNTVEVDDAGRIVRWDGSASTFKIRTERLSQVDFDGLVAAFTAAEESGRGMGALSPRDTVQASVGGASLAVDYSRPQRRGRTIFGQVVPWGEVWRTGANAATGFTTDRDLRIGGVDVPAGSYTLWTIPAQDGWELIVNRQTGQWGTEYDPAQDLARIDMRTEPLADPVDQFTIEITPDGEGGVLALTWDDTRAWVPIEVR